MRSSPLLRYQPPRFPTKLEVLATPELLRCGGPPILPPRRTLAAALAAGIAASPAFLLGTGCTAGDVLVPTVYLSEEEALAIILDETSKGGLALSTDPAALAHIVLPFEEDAVDLQRNVAVEYVSQQDCLAAIRAAEDAGIVADAGLAMDATGGLDRGTNSDGYRCDGYNMDEYEAIARDQQTQAELADPDLHFRAITQSPASSKQSAAAALRSQVVDFLDWLRANGVI